MPVRNRPILTSFSQKYERVHAHWDVISELKLVASETEPCDGKKYSNTCTQVKTWGEVTNAHGVSLQGIQLVPERVPVQRHKHGELRRDEVVMYRHNIPHISSTN